MPVADRETRKFWAQNNVAGKKGFQTTSGGGEAAGGVGGGSTGGGAGGPAELVATLSSVGEARARVLAELRGRVVGADRFAPLDRAGEEIRSIDRTAAKKLWMGYGSEIGSNRLADIASKASGMQKFEKDIALLRTVPTVRKSAFAYLKAHIEAVREVDASAARKLRQGYQGDLTDSRLEALVSHVMTGG